MSKIDDEKTILETLIGLDDRERHDDNLRWITESPSRREQYLHWAEVFDKAFPVGAPLSDAPMPPAPDIFDRISQRISESAETASETSSGERELRVG